MEISKNLDANIRRISRKKATVTVIALFLLLSITLTPIALPIVNAHTPPWNVVTFAFINVEPNPIGVNQQVLVYFWIDKPFPGAALGNDIRPHDYKLTITKPDGTIETKTWPIVFDSTSSQYTLMTPDQVGTYTLKFDYLGQTYTWVNGQNQNDTYLPSSASTTLIVQKDQITQPVNSYPLPSEYWTRPIHGENTDWWSISSNWLGNGMGSGTSTIGLAGWSSSSAATIRFPGDAIGPLTSHIMWTKPLRAGGVVGGNNFPIQGNTYFEGSAYNNIYTNPIIVNGKIYYTEPVSFTGTTAGPTDCVDLRTGQLIWSRTDVPALSFAYIYDVEDPNQHGVYPPILFTSNFARAFDADTGNPLFNVTGVPSGTTFLGPQGEQLRLVMTNLGNSSSPDYRLAQWNSSKLWTYTGLSPSIDTSTTTTYAWVNTTTYVNNVKTVSSVNASTATVAVNASIFDSSNSHNRYDWNVSIPWRNTMTGSPSVIAGFYNDVMILRNGSLPTYSTQTPYTYFAINLNASKGAVGSVLWWQTYNPPATPANVTIYNGGADPQSRIFLEMYKETRQWTGYSMTTGSKIWGPTASQVPLDYYGQPYFPILGGQIAYGKLYSSAYGGVVYTYNMADGKLLWTYGNGGPGNSTSSNSVQGNYPTYIAAVGNGKIYTITTEHTIQTPIYKGAETRCIDAETGAEIWTLSDYTGTFSTIGYAIADGFANYFNGYDNQIYTIGRGPSAITVEAPIASITQGSSLVIRGSVTDISAGTNKAEQAARFPNGVPAVSDASQSDWMEYVYMQKPRPTDATGVDVKITVIDPNGNGHEFTTTSDSMGQFSYLWSPPVPGKYTVIAQFAGSNAYWPSIAETSFGVDQAPTAEPPATPTPTITPTATPTTAPNATASPTTAPSPTAGLAVETYIAIAAVVIIVAIAVAAVLLRRRK